MRANRDSFAGVLFFCNGRLAIGSRFGSRLSRRAVRNCGRRSGCGIGRSRRVRGFWIWHGVYAHCGSTAGLLRKLIWGRRSIRFCDGKHSDFAKKFAKERSDETAIKTNHGLKFNVPTCRQREQKGSPLVAQLPALEPSKPQNNCKTKRKRRGPGESVDVERWGGRVVLKICVGRRNRKIIGSERRCG